MTWTLHKQPADLVADHGYSIFDRDEEIIFLIDPMPGKEAELERLVHAVNNIDRITAERDGLEEQVAELKHGVEDQLEEAIYHRERRTAAEAERDAMRAALEPFASFAEVFSEQLPDTYEFLVKLDAVPIFKASVGQFRRARAALTPSVPDATRGGVE